MEYYSSVESRGGGVEGCGGVESRGSLDNRGGVESRGGVDFEVDKEMTTSRTEDLQAVMMQARAVEP